MRDIGKELKFLSRRLLYITICLGQFFFLLLYLQVRAFQLTVLPLHRPVHMNHIQGRQKQQPHQQKDDADRALEERIFGKHALQILPLQLDLVLIVDHLFGLDKQRPGIVLIDQGGRK